MFVKERGNEWTVPTFKTSTVIVGIRTRAFSNDPVRTLPGGRLDRLRHSVRHPRSFKLDLAHAIQTGFRTESTK